MSISSFGMKPHSFSQASIISQMSSSQTASTSSKLLPKRGQSQKFVKARSTNIKPKANYQNMRLGLNAGLGGVQRTMTAQSTSSIGLNSLAGYNSSVSNANSAMTGAAMGVKIGQEVYGLLNKLGVTDKLESKIFGNSGNVSNSKALDNAIGSLGGGDQASAAISGDVGGLINGMAGAQDSATLRTSISLAEDGLGQMKSKLPGLEKNFISDQKRMGELTQAHTDAQKGVKEASNNLGKASQGVKGATESRDAKQKALSQADKEYGKLSEAYTQAHDKAEQASENYNTAFNARSQAQTNYETAQRVLETTPQTIPGPDGSQVENPAYAKAQQAVSQAKDKFDEAKAKENEAKTKMDEAMKAESEALEAKNAAFKKLGDTKDAVKTAEDALDKAQKQLDGAKTKENDAKADLEKAQTAEQKAEAELDKAKDTLAEFKAQTMDINTLESAIKDQKKRLEKMENAEIKEFDNANHGIEKANQKNKTYMSKIDSRDGMSKKEVKRLDKIAANNEANQTRSARAADLEDNVIQTLLERAQAKIDEYDNEYKQITVNGAEKYFKNGQEVSQQEFNKQYENI